jgi:hypothetical protein
MSLTCRRSVSRQKRALIERQSPRPRHVDAAEGEAAKASNVRRHRMFHRCYRKITRNGWQNSMTQFTGAALPLTGPSWPR